MRNDFRWDSRIIQLFELLIDMGVVIGSLIIVLLAHGELQNITISTTFDFIVDLVIANSVLLLSTVIFFRVYRISVVKTKYRDLMPRIILALIMANLITVFSSMFLNDLDFSKTIFIYSFAVQVMFFVFIKYVEFYFFQKVNVKTAIIIGPKDQADKFAKKLISDKSSYVELKYIIYEDENNTKQCPIIEKYINRVEYIYLTANLYEEKKNTIIAHCIEHNKTFFLIPKIYELAIKNASIENIGDVLVYQVQGLELTLEQRFLKRTFDLIVGLVGLILTSPIMLLTAIVVKLYDRGPVFFKQERLTYKNRTFTLIKFRTMIPDAEKHTGPVLASDKDPRITKLGSFMRKTRVDELPQFFNIIKGDMSIVGPRPEREFFVEQFKKENPSYKYRLNVRAGVTGLAQALGKYNTTYDDKLRYDLFYIRNYSFFQDLYILLHTIRAIFQNDSAQGLLQDFNVIDHFDNQGYIYLESDIDKDVFIITRK
ncbi:sugar transferase [Candidatus Xianfuyuplasma coldseepsis]|uniref:Sugar transferase n=1 Tax=Candidatus Xianfuyuplasma coldseepsis TaxID=2782163 RepID=A0A7L7KQL3_9MOLU|nr:sugar transferase [Xianfuyuplasma coldseepsis]QMS84516.1 sugar transferase [Xianfuyuplasma coldseepsis]